VGPVQQTTDKTERQLIYTSMNLQRYSIAQVYLQNNC